MAIRCWTAGQASLQAQPRGTEETVAPGLQLEEGPCWGGAVSSIGSSMGGWGLGWSSFLGHAAKDDLVQLLANALEPVEGVHLPRRHSRPVCRPSADRLSRKSFSMPTVNTRTDSTRHVVRICRSVQVWAFAVGMHMFVWGEGPDLHSGIGTLWRGALVKSFISS